jgi:ribosomal protein S18 acetylase RimI-like enzyme
VDVAVVRTRPVTADDEVFLRDLFALTHFSAGFGPPADDPVWSTLLDVQYRARTGSWVRRHPAGRDSVIVADGDEVGRVWTAPDGDAVRVVDIAVWPRAQGRGIGTAVMEDLQRSAGAVVLTVANDNRRAAAWYRRLGFRKESADVMYTAMRWTAG